MRASSPAIVPVIEFGLVGQTMHQIDERTPVADLEKLTKSIAACWTGILRERPRLIIHPHQIQPVGRRDRAAGGAAAGGERAREVIGAPSPSPTHTSEPTHRAQPGCAGTSARR